VRGVAEGQNLDPYIAPIVAEKMKEFPDGKQYEKKAEDVEQLRVIYNKSFKVDQKTEEKTHLDPELTKEELVFLYEIKFSIDSFGYGKHPRIAELRQARKDAGLLEQDMLSVFDCTKEQIATTKEHIAKNKEQGIETKAYVGSLYPNIFAELSNLENIYTSFPEDRIRKRTIEIGGESKETLEQKMKAQNIMISDNAKSMLDSKDFITSKEKYSFDTLRLTIRELGFPDGATVDQIYKKADELGLDLCPSEVGPQYRLEHMDQPMNDYLLISMKQITDSGGDPYVFGLSRDDVGLWLGGRWARPRNHWLGDRGIVFSPRK